MRFAAAVTVLLACQMAPHAHAFSVCPTIEFVITFDPNSAELDASDLEILDVGSARARQCNIGGIELIVVGDLEAEDSLASRRVLAVREVLVRNGLSPDVLQSANESREMHGHRVSPTPDAVTVVTLFD